MEILYAHRIVVVEVRRAGGMIDGRSRGLFGQRACHIATLCAPKTPHGLPWQRGLVSGVRRRKYLPNHVTGLTAVLSLGLKRGLVW
jgi:hypothetical protein